MDPLLLLLHSDAGRRGGPDVMKCGQHTILAVSVSSALLGALGCQRPSHGGELQLVPHASEMFSDNGLTTNGLTLNGLTTNGLTTNGLTTNGLATNGLSLSDLVAIGFAPEILASGAFAAWFNSNTPSNSDMIVRYVVRCAVPSWDSRSATINGVSYSWPGELGLAPSWAAGNPMPLVEQQLLSACLAAHVNKFGVHVALSIRGRMSDGSSIPTSSAEKAAYPISEGCFFGNLFDGTGVYSAVDSGFMDPAVSSPRACVEQSGQPGQCAPMVSTLRSCSQICTSTSDGWTSCRWAGQTFATLNTHLAPASVYLCGDNVCQFTETCYDRKTGTGCARDCGKCP